ncbi:hypothetical protein LOTGIDRAFT_154326 [Lottia gigantea]|uniref:Uncharacterized protein n=1 Tax=Lottia gigantea TaxID=225164 RepID=V4A7G1_LOTGI|nr:hypothetical protein LOTGIDRAFT_154326 [Lottia gigantea]ESO89236.1 hypothetical protein LOTGIDRAFT_154326 [Lottia gigantea]
MSASLRYRPIEERELAKDFGFDVTAPSGGVQTSGANNREYKTECRKIYSEFLMNMRDYIFQEEQIKKELTKLRAQTASPHKQARDPIISLSSRCSSTRRDSLYSDTGLHDKEILRPGRIDLSKKRPKTVIGTVRGRDVNLDHVDGQEDNILPDIITTHGGSTSITTNQTVKHSSSATDNRKQTSPRDREDHNAIVESSSDFACSRVIRMNPRAYSKLVCGKANVHVLNRSSGYLLKPVSETKTDVLMPKNVGRSNVPERLAIVRERTNFKSPTLSNDLKVNNLLAIKKSLVGDTSPRLTVGHVMNSARERRSRLYRIQLTSDVIEHSKIQDQRSPRISHYCKSKAPCSSPPTARLTRKNLARFEQDIQKEAIEKLRKTVVEMVSSVENRVDEENHSGDKHSIQSRRCDEYPVDRIHEDAYLYNQHTPRIQEQDAIADSDHRPKYDTGLRRMSRVSYLEPVTKTESRRGSTFLERIKDGSRSRLRSEMSTRPSTMHSGFCSENSSPRRVSHQETIALVKQSKTDDDYRDNELNLWRQRMIFAAGKKDLPVSKV